MGTMQMFKKYSLTDDELQQVANLAKQEQGSVEGAKAEASLMCNLLETHYTKYGSDPAYSNGIADFDDDNNT